MGTGLPEGAPARRARARWLWLAAGWVAVAFGAVGIVVPGLPTTVFFIVVASCFARSSPRFEQWVLTLPKIGPVVGDYRAGLGMRRRTKAIAITTMVSFVGLSAGLLLHSLVWRLVVLGLGALGAWYVGWRVPTRERVLEGRG